jgi:hypothetical protein
MKRNVFPLLPCEDVTRATYEEGASLDTSFATP